MKLCVLWPDRGELIHDVSPSFFSFTAFLFMNSLTGIKIVAYSPLGRGFLTGSIRGLDAPALEGFDFRKLMPKFAEGNLQHNLALVDVAQALADRKGCSVSMTDK